jgi:hypothetical protein
MKLALTVLSALVLTINILLSQVNLEWERVYRGPQNWDMANKIDMDNSGNVYVTGWSMDNNIDKIATIKYNPQGDSLWVSRFSPAPFDTLQGVGIQTNNSGNIYVLGYSPDTIYLVKYDSSGTILWNRIFEGQNGYGASAVDLMLDNQGNIIIAGSNGNDALVFSYDPNGNIRWVTVYNNAHDINSLDVDASGNTYVTGISNADCFIMKLNSSGVIQWTNTYNGSQNGVDQGMVVKADNSGNSYITGWSFGQFSQWQDVVTIKYNSSGIQQWVQRAYSPLSAQFLSWDMALDNNNNILVLATKPVNSSTESICVLKYSSNGSLTWEYNYIVQNHMPWAMSIECDAYNNIYIAGIDFINPSLGTANPKILTMKLNPQGAQNWVQLHDSSVDTVHSSGSYRNKLRIHNNSVYVLGSYGSQNSNTGYVTLKYTEQTYTVSGQVTFLDNNEPVPAGGHVKAFYYDESSASIITVDSAIIQQGGFYTLTNVPRDTLDLMFYQNDDLLQFVPTYYESTIDWREATPIYATQNLTNINCKVFRINNTQNPFNITGQTFHNSELGVTSPIGNAVIYAKIGNDYKNYGISQSSGLYIVTKLPAGSYSLTAHRYGFAPVNLSVTINNNNVSGININFGSPIGIQQISGNIPTKFALSQNYPNPFNPATTIKFALPKAGIVRLSVYDIIGREVKELVNQNLSAGEYETKWDASAYSSGIYFYRIETADFTDTKKMVLIK